jgi:hypothetical protein
MRLEPGLLARHLGQLEQRAVEDAHQHLAGAIALGLGHVGFHEVGNRLQARGFAIASPAASAPLPANSASAREAEAASCCASSGRSRPMAWLA